MSPAPPALKVFLDEGVPISVGDSFENAGHAVLHFKDAAAPGSPDQLVCAISEANDAVLVAIDGDMKKLAQRRGVGAVRFRRLSLIKLSCRPSKAAGRVTEAMSLIEHEWSYAETETGRRLFIEIGDTFIKSMR